MAVTSYKTATAAAGTNWSNPTNVYSSDNNRASYANSAQNNLYVTGFDFSDLPDDAIILGFEILVEWHGTSGTAGNRSIKAGLTKDGSSLAGAFAASQNLPQTTDANRTYWSASSLFSTTRTAAEVKASTFGAVLATNNTNTSARNIDLVQVRVHYLVDDFNDNSIDTTLRSSRWGWQVVETSQQMQLTTTTAAWYYGIDGATAFSLVGKSVSIELVSAWDQDLVSYGCYFTLFLDSSNLVYFFVSNDTIYAYRVVALVYDSVSMPYDPSTHKYLRIRESGGTTYREYSSNGYTRNELKSLANPITMTALKVELMVGTDSAEASTTTAIYDNLNILPSAPAPSSDGNFLLLF